MRNSFGAVRSLDRKAFTVTSGPRHIGADNVNSLSTEHIPTSADRAILQGYEEEDLPRFLASTSETCARKMVADVIPPPFANKMAHAVYPHLRSKRSAHKLKAQLKVTLEKADLTYRQAKKAVEQVSAGVFTMSAFVDALSLNEEAASRVEILQASTATTDRPGTTKAETTKLQPLDVWDLKQHVTPSKAKLAGLEMNRYRYGHEDCEIIVPSFTMESGGKVPKRVCEYYRQASGAEDSTRSHRLPSMPQLSNTYGAFGDVRHGGSQDWAPRPYWAWPLLHRHKVTAVALWHHIHSTRFRVGC